MPSVLSQISASALLAAAVVAAWRWRGGNAARDERDGAAILAAWWRWRCYPLALVGVALVVLAVASSVIDAATLVLAVIVWILAEMRRALDARRHARQRADMAGFGAVVAMMAVFLVAQGSRLDGVVAAFDVLLVVSVGLMFLARRFVNWPMPGPLGPLIGCALLAWHVHWPMFGAPPLRTVDDALTMRSLYAATIVEHLDAARVPHDRGVTRAEVRSGLDGTSTLASFLARADDLVRLGWETADDVARWRELRAEADDTLLDHPTSLRLLARHGATDVDADDVAARALAHVDEAPPDERLSAAITAVDTLDALGRREALATLVDDVHALIMERRAPLPTIDGVGFGDTPEMFAPLPVCHVTALIRRIGPPPGLDIAAVARGALYAASSGSWSGYSAAAAHAELVARDDYEVSVWRRLVRHRVALGAALVALVAIASALPTLRAPRTAGDPT